MPSINVGNPYARRSTCTYKTQADFINKELGIDQNVPKRTKLPHKRPMCN